ncbi:MAG: helix-turn-helix transcriptional regulator [Proteobacteria bacterium]|nr:helix-turn-helix transcriptional regulator [Pseudomonadota bacterium]
MVSMAALAETASLVGDPARANMLAALMDGRALTASELARAASVAPQTASGHLARLTEAGLLAMERQGRHRYHRLASPAVARMLEGIMAVAAEGRAVASPRPVVTGPRDRALRAARTCYDHLAGRLAVDLADALTARGHLEMSADGGSLTPEGLDFLRGLGIALEHGRAGRNGRVFCRPCLDWSERRPHVAGAVGAALCAHCFAQGWVRRIDGSRALQVTQGGRRDLRALFGIEAG